MWIFYSDPGFCSLLYFICDIHWLYFTYLYISCGLPCAACYKKQTNVRILLLSPQCLYAQPQPDAPCPLQRAAAPRSAHRGARAEPQPEPAGPRARRQAPVHPQVVELPVPEPGAAGLGRLAQVRRLRAAAATRHGLHLAAQPSARPGDGAGTQGGAPATGGRSFAPS